ncbi:glycosyltransferase 87 family protein, partial [Sandarakinorhabdus sp.]|uniref:glycosyltransferase 87 family protein n=1 Tax=Sandarakinorhabdus sp. TaxID=1916663 RepID=UPI003567372C
MNRRKWIGFEWLLAAFIAINFANLAWQTLAYGYLPQPFFYESGDLWMDWFNTAWWAHNGGAYDTWGTLYPPLSFVLLKIMGLSHCYADSPGLETRACDGLGVAFIHLFYALNIVLAGIALSRIDRSTALPRAFALTAGMPMLSGLERANLVLICFTCMLFAFASLQHRAWVRWLALGMAINLKVYVIAALAGILLHHKWRRFEGAILATLVVYLCTFMLVGSGSPSQLAGNIIEWSGGFQSASILDLWYPNTYKPLMSLLEGTGFPIVTVVGSAVADNGLVA